LNLNKEGMKAYSEALEKTGGDQIKALDAAIQSKGFTVQRTLSFTEVDKLGIEAEVAAGVEGELSSTLKAAKTTTIVGPEATVDAGEFSLSRMLGGR
jgi:hypothetical protein